MSSLLSEYKHILAMSIEDFMDANHEILANRTRQPKVQGVVDAAKANGLTCVAHLLTYSHSTIQYASARFTPKIVSEVLWVGDLSKLSDALFLKQTEANNLIPDHYENYPSAILSADMRDLKTPDEILAHIENHGDDLIIEDNQTKPLRAVFTGSGDLTMNLHFEGGQIAASRTDIQKLCDAVTGDPRFVDLSTQLQALMNEHADDIGVTFKIN